MAIPFTPLVVLIVGLCLWFLAGNSKVAEVGRILFFVGSLAFLLGQKWQIRLSSSDADSEWTSSALDDPASDWLDDPASD